MDQRTAVSVSNLLNYVGRRELLLLAGWQRSAASARAISTAAIGARSDGGGGGAGEMSNRYPLSSCENGQAATRNTRSHTHCLLYKLWSYVACTRTEIVLIHSLHSYSCAARR